ncbi:molybdenum cofactor guanylyltransferase MobA [Staphylococcus pettenkoferi]|uniref:Probable molybdenum cofactor guanylyltransferase n=1 Tax=Staphylococcus pettenkoferi TaxID=170573 RepID=A0A9Q4D351_9STAP|nr:molybdenum cofactor guanylyltransferase MobA [Staphylococcus pettenkoferi]MCY1569184.1 molybdenum cofactor guanylyltransferase MobA [Staphylococcus pettenkoferi]MCY1575218.1 molybdenum cofactor guanylyltransferase MobA [Staphylococcus pettenkoferi]MCY1593838.1 molybdenum cofactor guanylyltransferase MobA [Staphylococcus pettenkoferi]MCY1618734.1 molybdenum cofactor guanylyltransferase MobA [Staphylococcus pettenkoferi]
MRAVILAGGHSERFGSPKAFAEINEETFYQKLLHTLKAIEIFDDILISTNEQLAQEFEAEHVVTDIETHRDKGPLAGIYTAFQYGSQPDALFVVSVDTPMVTVEAIQHLYEVFHQRAKNDGVDIVGYQDGKHAIPTLAFYHSSVQPQLQEVLESDDFSMKHLYKQVSTSWIGVEEIPRPPYWYWNINYQQDLAQLREALD